MNKKKIGIVSGVAAVGAALGLSASYIVTKGLVKIAIEREIPKGIPQSKKKISGSPDPTSFSEQLRVCAERLAATPMEQLELSAQDGARLVAHWYPCENAKRVIVAMHGWRSSWWRDFGIISDFWRENRCTVLYAEQRGQNGSGGDHMGFGLLERFDCLEWARWVSDHFNLPVYLAGVSMGATTVLMASGLELPGSVRGIIADCGFTSPEDIWRHVTRHNLHLSYSVRRAAANSICRRKIQMGANEYSTLTALENNRVPVLFIHGADDHFVPVEMTYENYKACTAPKRLLVVPGADHGMSYLLEPEGYQGMMTAFWNTFR